MSRIEDRDSSSFLRAYILELGADRESDLKITHWWNNPIIVCRPSIYANTDNQILIQTELNFIGLLT